jgi:integrase
MNVRYTPIMYNEEAKKEFLSNYSDLTALAYGRVFLKSKDIEKVYGEDLYNFNLEQIENVLYDLRPTSYAASKSNASIISMYINWAIEKGLRSNINPLDISSGQDFKKYVAFKTKEMYKTEEEIFAIIDSMLENPQDQVCVILPFFGVQGQGCAELLNLKKDDVDFKNYKLHLVDADGSERTLKIEHERVDYIFNVIIKDALEVKEYLKKNGQMDTSRPNIREYTNLVENDYIVRTSDIRTENYNSPALSSVVYRRIAFMGKEFGLPTIKYIVRSGMLAMARKLWKRDGELGNEQYEEIMKFYNYKNRNNLREFITIQTIKDVYGDE